MAGRATLTLRGTVADGVEAGCIVLVTDEGSTYVLLDGDPEVIRAGARIEVQGVIRDDLLSHCQQGPLVDVASTRPI